MSGTDDIQRELIISWAFGSSICHELDIGSRENYTINLFYSKNR